MYKITLIPGDGIGPEIISQTVRVIKAAGVEIEWEEMRAGEEVMEEKKTPLPEEVMESIKKNKVALKGPITTPVGSGFRSVNVALRQKLDLYVNLRPAKSFEGVDSPFKNIDLVMVRENTEGLYSGVERYLNKERTAAESANIITRKASERIVRFAFEYALKEGRKKVTAIHKANILKYSSGLFLKTAREVAGNYPQVEFEEKIVDNMAMQLVKKPNLYDVLVTTNLFGDILSDLCSGLVGGLGLAPGANIGDELAVFEPVHGSAPKYKGMDKVNPSSAILAGTLMLKHIGEKEAGEKIVAALAGVIKEGKWLTYDLGGTAKTSEMAEAIIENLSADRQE
jgi:isocitrate dehydrogenase (NAD+)